MKWEYKIIQPDAIYSENYKDFSTRTGLFNQLGEEGWELIGMTKSDTTAPVCYFKRPVSQTVCAGCNGDAEGDDYLCVRCRNSYAAI